MEKVNLTWNLLKALNEANLNLLENDIKGVYRLSYKHEDGNIYVFYVGESADIKKVLLNHFTASDKECIVNHLKVSQCYFRYAQVESQEMRKKILSKLYKFYQPHCNDPIPVDDNSIEINIT